MDGPQRKRIPIKGLSNHGHYEPGNGKRRGRKRNSTNGPNWMTQRQRQFIREYLVDNNAKRAAIRAGYSEKASGPAGIHLLKHPIVGAEIKRLLEEKLKTIELTAEGVLSKMKSLTSGDIRDIFDANGDLLHPRRLPESIVARVASIKVTTKRQPSDTPDGGVEVVFINEIKLWGMDVQLTNLAKAFAMFTEKPMGEVTINIKGGLPDDNFNKPDIEDDKTTII